MDRGDRGRRRSPKIMTADIRVRILYSTLVFLVQSRHVTGLKISLLKTVAFLNFQIFHKRDENFVSISNHEKILSYLDIVKGHDTLEEKN